MNKELFYQKMQPYFQSGMIREIYSSDKVCIMCLGETGYVASPYIEFDDGPFGILVDDNIMKKIIKDDDFLYLIADTVLKSEEDRNMLYVNLKLKNMENIKKWIKNNRDKSIVDYNMEEELTQMIAQKSK